MQEFSQNDQKGWRAFDLSSAPKCSPLNFDLNGNSQTLGWIYHMLVRALRIGVLNNTLPKIYQTSQYSSWWVISTPKFILCDHLTTTWWNCNFVHITQAIKHPSAHWIEYEHSKQQSGPLWASIRILGWRLIGNLREALGRIGYQDH